MYLEHYGLNEPPFRITPVTEFFFSGANRGEILDALIYSLSEAEGIIKVSGEVGSGKTMLCRMLIERLPDQVETIYLANPSLSREELLYAIADALDLSFDSERVGIIMQSIQNKLLEKARLGKRIVVLVDEAHAMPLDTLEELRLLYNLQVGSFKLLQIILFGQPELDEKLNQPNMRQLKDRIVHHFHMQPLSRNILENYLMFRMRAAGYHGPNIFSPNAIKLIAKASNGLMRRANILADKSLLAAFVADTHNIEVSHVQAAIRDSELKQTRPTGNKMLLGGVISALLLIVAAWWLIAQYQTTPGFDASTTTYPVIPESVAKVNISNPEAASGIANTQTVLPSPPVETTTTVAAQKTATATTIPSPEHHTVIDRKASLFDQRWAAGQQLLEKNQSVSSIQLFYNEDIQKSRIEGFLRRAKTLGKLSEIYLLPEKFSGKQGLRVLYGTYSSPDAARNAMQDLPARYQKAFATSLTVYTP